MVMTSVSLSTAQEKAAPSDLLDSIKNYTLHDVQISRKEFQPIHSLPVPSQRLSGKRLQNLNSLSLADALRFFSGVQLKDYGGVGGLKTINIRSLGTQHTAVFYDGLALGNVQSGQIDLGKFSLNNMEEVTLYNGQNPDLLQPAKAYAASNSIYLKTKKPTFKDPKRINASLNLKSGSFGLLNPSLNLDYKINDKIFTRISSEYLKAHGKYTFRYSNGVYDTTAVRNNTDISSTRIEAGINGEQNPNTSWALKYYHYQSERGLPGAVIANRFEYSQRLWDRNNFVQINFQKRIKPAYKLAIKGKFAHDYTRYLDPEFINLEGFLDNRYTQKEAYLSLANEFQLLSFWRMGLSTDYQYNTLDANLYRFSYPLRKTFLVALASDLRFHNLSIQGNLLSTFVFESVREFQSASSKRELSPALLFNWKPLTSDIFRVRGFYKSIFRMPTFNDLYYTFVGNTYLNPEYTQQVNLGFSYSQTFNHPFINQLNIQSDVYYNRVKDKIVAMPSANLFRWTMVNLGRVEIQGLEIGMNTKSAVSYQLMLSSGLTYTYQKAIDLSPEGYTFRHQILYTPLHSGSFIAALESEHSGVNYSFIYTGERYSQKANIPINYVEPWYTHDVSVWHAFRFNKQLFTVRAEVNNLFNQYYDVILNFPMPGRHYRFNLTVNL